MNEPALPSKPLALLCGDPAGVGPDIIARWLEEAPENQNKVVPIGPQSWLDTLPIPGIPAGPEGYKLTPGLPDNDGQRVALDAMEIGAAGCLDGRFSGVVTGPINKTRMAANGYPYPGQTEFFADRWGGTPVMAFAGGQMKVVLATWHIPMHSLCQALTKDVFARSIAAAAHLANSTGISGMPRIGVCGLNPHAGENGLLGTDERDRFNPWLEELRNEYVSLSTTCQPADTIFRRHLQGEFDVVVALYHDQGLAPLKTVEFEQSVNITLGLPYIRTSPDHGTAYPLAGKKKASLSSWDNAVRLTRLLAK
ncbi:MAG: 4-hydroxythreonine-4-phosphate dehydrogenase PdxA [Puniceicoccales bacterium]|jgi:4-hydroxythreonine-4-phosphate dehydrogenase|nr:4-hydroxythreonine-4-phosphate dehydrogenase PdxA [Puniceicoccales bacterium]